MRMRKAKKGSIAFLVGSMADGIRGKKRGRSSGRRRRVSTPRVDSQDMYREKLRFRKRYE